MRRFGIVLLVVGWVASTVMAFGFQYLWRHEITRPVIIEARYIPQTGDIQARLQHRPDWIVTFPNMCPSRIAL